MKIAVMGAGGVGGYFGGRLAAHGEEVTFIARGEHLRAIQAEGLRVDSVLGSFRVHPASATDDPSLVGPVDVVMFCVKMWDTESAALAIRPLAGPSTAVVSFQNGVHNEEVLARTVGADHVLGGVAYVTATIAAPGVIAQDSGLARLVFGEMNGNASARVLDFHRACVEASIDAMVSPDIVKELWTKFLYICALSGVCTLVRRPLGPVLQDPDTRGLLADCMREVEAVARAKGVRLDPDIVEAQLERADAFGNDLKPSMLNDLERGGRLELEWLSGAVARMGRELGIDAPSHRFIYTALKLDADGTRHEA